MVTKKKAEEPKVKSKAKSIPTPKEKPPKKKFSHNPKPPGEFIPKTSEPRKRSAHESQVVTPEGEVISSGGEGGMPKSIKQVMRDLAKAEAKLSGILPHEFLLNIVRGEPIVQRYAIDIKDDYGVVVEQKIYEKEVYPTMEARTEAAKAAAPYFAPRLATQVVTIRGREDVLNNLTDEQLDSLIASLEKGA